MGPAGLTAVFGMGTGVAPPVWSPENRPAGGQAAPAAILRWSVTRESAIHAAPGVARLARTACEPLIGPVSESSRDRLAPLWGGEPIGVVKLLGC